MGGAPAVQIRMPAVADSIGLSRLVAGAVGNQASSPIEDMDVLRMAVDELCHWLIGDSDGAARRFEVTISSAPGAVVARGQKDRPGVGGFEEVSEVVDAGAAFRSESLTRMAEDGSSEFVQDAGWVAGALAGGDRLVEAVDDNDEARRLLDVLSDREPTIGYLRFFEGLTQPQIAARVGLNQMHVSFLLQRCLVQLRAAVRSSEVTVAEEEYDAGDVLLTDEP